MTDDYISREDAIEIINQGRLTKLIDADVAESGLKDLPAADVVQVVHCRDCKHLANRDEEGGKCWRGNGFARTMKNDDYCSYGERKE